MRIQNNTAAFNVWSSYSKNSAAMKKSMTKLSTGVISNTDDAAGLGISETMRAEVKGVAMARQNVNNGISLIQTGDSWLQKISDMLGRMKALAIESKGIVSSTDKGNIQEEFEALNHEIGRITGKSATGANAQGPAAASFNGLNLFDGSAGTAGVISVQIGATSGQTLAVSLTDLTSLTGGPSGGHTLETAASAGTDNAISIMSTAVNTIATTRASLGAQQVRMEHTASALTSYEDNLRAAESKIRDVDMARESTIFAKNQILSNASNAMLAQANQLPQSVMQLLG